jgi:hypothetical protein
MISVSVFLSNCGIPEPNTPKSALATISYLCIGISMDYDEAKLKTQFNYLSFLVKDEEFFGLIYELKKKDYGLKGLYIKDISEDSKNSAKTTVQMRWEQKGTQVGYSQKQIFKKAYRFTLQKMKDSAGKAYWAITEAKEGTL